jgi:serine/threonine protein kinase
VASALDYAHTLKFTLGGNSYDGIIHRDLKPANILVSKRSEIKLTDFGIARPAQAGLHTIDGNIVGTLHYLSPEQLENGKIDRRSDIYSFGTILYEMATGVKAFPQKSITELTMRRAANDFKSPDDFDTPVTPAISNIILKCLKAPAEERYRRVAELIGDLRKTYAEIAPDSAPQKTLYEFFTAKNTNDAGVTGITPTVLISVGAGTDNAADAGVNAVNATNMDTGGTVNATDDAVAASIDTNTNINTVDTAFNTRADTGIDTAKKSPTIRKTTACAAAISIMLLSALYLTAKIISHRQPKTDGKQSAATVKFFSAPVNTDTQSAAANVSPPVNTHTAAVNNASAPNTAGTASVDTVDIDTASINTAGVDTAVVDTTGINAANVNAGNANTNNINAGNIHTAKPAPVTESALIKNAAEAIAKKEWDRAVRLLEKNNAAFTEKRGERNLLLFEAYVESRQLEKARTVIDSAAQTNDALYFLTAGRYMFYRNDHANALAALETSLTRSSAMRDRNAIIGDALFYIAMIRSNRFKASPAEITRKQAQDAWRRVKSAYESRPESAQFKRAEAEILELY